jgi:hypothetical protein
VPLGAAWLSGLLALGALGVVCCGGGLSSLLSVGLAGQSAQIRDEVATLRDGAERLATTEGLLDEIGDRLDADRMARRQYPAVLPVSPPKDGWGTPLRYEQQGPDAALLRSAGPDRVFGTADDLSLELDAR